MRITSESEWSLEIGLRLAETITWVSGKAPAALRTGEFWPDWLPKPDDGHGSVTACLLESAERTRRVVEFIASRRRVALGRSGMQPAPARGEFAGGRILCTDFNTDLCAASGAVSGEFFDHEDIPAWDTWFHHWNTGDLGGVVACWIPSTLIEAVDRGISVIPVSCAWWEDSPPPGTRRFWTGRET